MRIGPTVFTSFELPIRRRALIRLSRVAYCIVTLISAAQAEDWPHWRGPDRKGVVKETSGWRDGAWHIKEVWRAETGAGGASPLVVGEQVFVFGWAANQEHLRCLDVTSGQEIWKQSYPAPPHSRLAMGEQNLYSGPSGSPSYSAETGLLLTLGADGDLRCWNARQQGTLVWSKNLIETYKVPQRPKVGRVSVRDYGYTSAPLLLGEELIVEVGAADCTLVSLNLRDGQERWRSKAVGAAGHSGGPVPMMVDGIPCVANFGWKGLLIARVDAGHQGETVCEVPWQTNYANNVAGPTVVGQSVIVTSEYNQAKIAKYDISLAAGAKLVWEHAQSSKICSPVVLQNRVCWAWRKFQGLDLTTGVAVLSGGETGDAGSLIVTADERLILWCGQGDLQLIESPARSMGEFRMLAEFKGLGASDAWPHVVMANGRIYCKDRLGRLVCLQVTN